MEQHQQINTLLAQLSNNKESNSFELLEKLANLVYDHLRYEERQLFPFMEKVLTNDQLQTIGKQLSNDHSLPLKDEYKDEFWVNHK
ncbi:MAG: hemerythrin domain-containing protein [Ginsengibacter sp.]